MTFGRDSHKLDDHVIQVSQWCLIISLFHHFRDERVLLFLLLTLRCVVQLHNKAQ